MSHSASTPSATRKLAGTSVSHQASTPYYERLDKGKLRPIYGREHYRVGTHQLFHKGEERAQHRIRLCLEVTFQDRSQVRASV